MLIVYKNLVDHNMAGKLKDKQNKYQKQIENNNNKIMRALIICQKHTSLSVSMFTNKYSKFCLCLLVCWCKILFDFVFNNEIT